jgi:hypothetical protein
LSETGACWRNPERFLRGICSEVVVLDIRKKFVVAMIAYAVLAFLAGTTLSNDLLPIFGTEIRLRTATFLVLGLFAVKTSIAFWRLRIEERQDVEQADLSKPM